MLKGDRLHIDVPAAMSTPAILEAIVRARAGLQVPPRRPGPGRPRGYSLTVVMIRDVVTRLRARGLPATQWDVAAELLVGERTLRAVLAREGTTWRSEFPAGFRAGFRASRPVLSPP